jgi:hypothetical protein
VNSALMFCPVSTELSQRRDTPARSHSFCWLRPRSFRAWATAAPRPEAFRTRPVLLPKMRSYVHIPECARTCTLPVLNDGSHAATAEVSGALASQSRRAVPTPGSRPHGQVEAHRAWPRMNQLNGSLEMRRQSGVSPTLSQTAAKTSSQQDFAGMHQLHPRPGCTSRIQHRIVRGDYCPRQSCGAAAAANCGAPHLAK